MTALYLARHGETEENVAGILQGHLPGHLTERGRRQAAALRDRLAAAPVRFDAFLVSDLRRVTDTARIVNEALRLPLSPTPLLRERDWGSLTGKPVAQARGMAEFPEDVESVEEMFRRAHRFLIYIKERHAGQHVLALGHGLFNRCIQAALRGCAIRDVPRMQNAEVRRIDVGDFPGGAANLEDWASAD